LPEYSTWHRHNNNPHLRLLLRRLHQPRSSIRPLPIQPSLNRVTNPSHQQHQAAFRDLTSRLLRTKAYTYSRSLSRGDIPGKSPFGPPPMAPVWHDADLLWRPLHSYWPDATLLFLSLRPLWLRLAAGRGRILVSNVALFVVMKLQF